MTTTANVASNEIAEEGLVAGKRLLERHPNAAMLCLRIGYDAVYSLCGGGIARMRRTQIGSDKATLTQRQ